MSHSSARCYARAVDLGDGDDKRDDHGACSDDRSDDAAGDANNVASDDADKAAGDSNEEQNGDDAPTIQVSQFRVTTMNHDDWLHRGPELEDFELYHYCAHIQRVPLPPRRRFEKQQGPESRGFGYFLFDDHYALSRSFCQAIRPRALIPRVVGASCPRADVHGADENALYKLLLFQPRRCPGPGACADPTSYEALVFPTGTKKAGIAMRRG